MSRRFGKPTTAGYVFLTAFIVIVVGIVVGATIAGGTGKTIDIVGAIMFAVLISSLRREHDPARPWRRPSRPLPRAARPGWAALTGCCTRLSQVH